MNTNILKTGVQNFIKNSKHTDTVSVLLKKPLFEDVSNKELAEQIEAYHKTKKKLPHWSKSANIYYPNKLNIEQTSSEITAKYKAEILGGKSLVDLTGGLGVDSYFFSKKFEKIIHCEISENLSVIARHNFKELGANNIISLNKNGIEFLRETKERFDAIFVDPSRRDSLKKKVFMLQDCTPDIIENLELLLNKSNQVLIKTSPLLDISLGLKELTNVHEIHIVAVENEVKELLWLIKKEALKELTIETVNIHKKGVQQFQFDYKDEQEATATFSNPLQYLYEPNSAILKSGAFKIISQQLGIHKLHENSHLYTSENIIHFPGRRFRIEKFLPYNRKSQRELKGIKANISTRNFPLSVQEIRSKHKIQDGGSHYIFFTKLMDATTSFLICSKTP